MKSSNDGTNNICDITLDITYKTYSTTLTPINIHPNTLHNEKETDSQNKQRID